MKQSDIEILRRFIINANTENALEGLLRLVKEADQKLYNRVIVLYSDYNSINERSHLGLGDFSQEKNRINLAILEILTALENAIAETIPTETTADGTDQITVRLSELEDKVELILSIVEKLHESALSKFIRSNLFRLLRPQTKNHLIALASLETESYDYNLLIQECYTILGLEFMEAIFRPLKAEILEETPKIDKKELLSRLEGNQKLEFYEFLTEKRTELSTRQMANLLTDNLNKKYNTKSKQYNYVFYFMLRKFVIIDRWQLEKDLAAFVEEKLDKKLNNILFSKTDYERIRDLMLKILRNLQVKQKEQSQ